MGTTDQERDQAAVDKAKGKVKEGWGKLTDDKSTELEGKFDQVKGNVREGVADIKDRLDDDNR